VCVELYYSLLGEVPRVRPGPLAHRREPCHTLKTFEARLRGHTPARRRRAGNEEGFYRVIQVWIVVRPVIVSAQLIAESDGRLHGHLRAQVSPPSDDRNWPQSESREGHGGSGGPGIGVACREGGNLRGAPGSARARARAGCTCA
jgi:hypothetical protein